jgi:hypothetical protein
MWKMVVSIVLVAASIAGAQFIKLGDLTLAQHLVRIMGTQEAKALGEGIVETVATAKTKVKKQLSARLAATKKPSEDVDVDGAEEADVEDVVDDVEEEAQETAEKVGRRRSLF